MIRASFPWWNTLHAWWSEHPKYAFQMVTNSASGAEKMVSDLEQAVSAPEQVVVENPTLHPPSSPPLSLSMFQLPHVNSPFPWAELPPQADLGLLTTDSPLFCMDLPLPLLDLQVSHPDSQLPDVKPRMNLEDSNSSSSHTLARSTPAPVTLKSKVDLVRQSSCTPGPKARKDFIADFHEATRIDQAQAQQEAQYHHVQQMARLELKKEKMRRKYEIESLKLQLQLAQAQSQQQQEPQQHRPGHDFGFESQHTLGP